MVLDMSMLIAANGTYQFDLSCDSFWQPSTNDCLTAIKEAQLPIDLNSISCNMMTKGIGILGGYLTLSFIWTQTGWTVKTVAAALEHALAKTGNFSFEQAQGATIDNLTKQVFDSSKSTPSTFLGGLSATGWLPDKSTMALIAGAGIILVLLGVGITSFARGAGEGAV
jgi:hypothetical protein